VEVYEGLSSTGETCGYYVPDVSIRCDTLITLTSDEVLFLADCACNFVTKFAASEGKQLLLLLFKLPE